MSYGVAQFGISNPVNPHKKIKNCKEPSNDYFSVVSEKKNFKIFFS
jgi:hypothetical protein